MATLLIPLSDKEVNDIQTYATREQVPVDSLIRNYLAYLIAGGEPVSPDAHQLPTSSELARIAEHGGSFDWIAEEPDLYSTSDGEPV